MNIITGGRMKTLLVLAVILCAEVPQIHSQNLLPIQTCKGLGGKLLNCACDNFIGDMNKVASEIVNLFNYSNPSNENEDFQLTINRFMEPLLDLLLPTYGQMCKNMSTFFQCLTSNGFDSSTNMIDKVATSFMKPDRVDDFFGDLCSLMTEINTHRQCILDNIMGSAGCVIIEFTNLNFMIDLSKPGGNDLLVNKMCPSIGSMTKCISIQFRTCGSKMRNDLETMVTSSATDVCKAKMADGSRTVFQAISVQCGMSIGQALSEPLTNNPNITSIVSTVLSSACNKAQAYLDCVRDEIVSSKNPMDIILKAMVDFSQLERVKTMIGPMCSNKDEQLKFAQCIGNPALESKIASCEPPEILTKTENVTHLVSLPADRIRGLLCTPTFKFLTCFLDMLNNTCGINFIKEFYAFPEILQLECNGTRSTTVAPPTQPSNVGDGSGGNVLVPSIMLMFLSSVVMSLTFQLTEYLLLFN